MGTAKGKHQVKIHLGDADLRRLRLISSQAGWTLSETVRRALGALVREMYGADPRMDRASS